MKEKVGGLLRVLVVEDCPDTTSTLAALLRIWGHEGYVARNGVEALELAVRVRPHVVLLDIGLPEMNGWDVAKRLREMPGGEGVILIAHSGYGQEADPRHSQEVGCHLHLTKPVDPVLLESLLSRLHFDAE